MKEAEEEEGNRRKGRGAEGELVGVVKKKAAEQVVDEVAAGRGTEGNSDIDRCRGLDCGVSGAAIDASNFRLRKAKLEKPTKMFRYMAGRLLKLSLFIASPPLQCRKNKRQIRRIKLATESKKNSWQREVERKEREEKRGENLCSAVRHSSKCPSLQQTIRSAASSSTFSFPFIPLLCFTHNICS